MAVYAFSDLHGQYALWKQIESFLKPGDSAYCLGDCGDRGPYGWQIIKEVLATPNITYIRGNHEQFIIDEDYWLWRCNGGALTIDAAESDTDKEWLRVQRELSETPLIKAYTNKRKQKIVLCHAGFDPELIQFWDDEEILWNRTHIAYSWPMSWKDSKIIVIHGHTPIQYMDKYISSDQEISYEKFGAYWYCKGRKCCIDQGSFMSGKTLLLDLDTFEEHIFTIKLEDMKYE